MRTVAKLSVLLAPRAYVLAQVFLVTILLHSVATAQLCCDPGDEFACTSGGGIYNSLLCKCRNMTPIIVSLSKNDVRLTSVGEGVRFDLDADGLLDSVAWTAPGSEDGFLVLDRNHNGKIDDGTELFGDAAPQPRSQNPNGFLALAEYDKRAAGGNEDGVISKLDAVFRELRIWVDRNHNGVAEPEELISLDAAGIMDISLEYRIESRVDRFGNRFRYRAKVNQSHPGAAGVWAWDVFLRYENSSSK